MENLEEKIQFYGNYIGSPVERIGIKEILTTSLLDTVKNNPHNNYPLLLKNLKNITDQDAIEVHKLIPTRDYGNEYNYCIHNWYTPEQFKWRFINKLMPSVKSNVAVYQYLQSKGYALQFRNYSVQDLIQKGWMKLI